MAVVRNSDMCIVLVWEMLRIGESVRTDLSGTWNFCLDAQKKGIECEMFNKQLDDTIKLPSTTAAEKKGAINPNREIGYLTEEYKFEGYAWYSREINFTQDILQMRENEVIELFLERTRKSYVWIDDQFVGSQLSFCAPHRYNIAPYINKPTHKLTVMISNVDYPTGGGHMTSPDTQTNWNGILGEISLGVSKNVKICDVQLYPSIADKSVRAVVELDNIVGAKQARVVSNIKPKQSAQETNADNKPEDSISNNYEYSLELSAGTASYEIIYPMQDEIKLWSEYDRNLYEINISIYIEHEHSEESLCDERTLTFGFRDFKAVGMDFEINGVKAFLRGKHDGMIFPLTGYAPMDKAGWLRVLGISKEYGINHYRFHTCCPPKAAFEAADELGIYMEPELPFWGTVRAPGEENYDAVMQEFLLKEGELMLREFGNHPSFVMMSMGNELWGSKEAIREMLIHYKKLDKRHLYTQGSNNFQFYPTDEPEDDFFSGVRFSKERLIRGSYAMCDAPLGHIQAMEPNSIHNYDDMICPRQLTSEETDNKEKTIEIQFGTGVKKVEATAASEMIPDIPVVSHEIGQYETFPDFSEIDKYTGVLKARNFEVFRERLAEKNMLWQADDFFKASGQLAAQCYKFEIETAMRSEKMAGFQLLDLQDFSGQGTALVGMLNAFMENKGIITAEQWREFCSDAVLMLELPRFVFEAGQKVESRVLLRSYRPDLKEFQHCTVKCFDNIIKVNSEDGTINQLKNGLNELGRIEITMPDVSKPQKFIIEICLPQTDIKNEYEIWVYPRLSNTAKAQNKGELHISAELDDALAALEAGKKVLFLPSEKQNINSIKGTYCTDFWCYPMFRSISESVNRAVPIGTMGLLIQNDHAALADFPCEKHTTPQWWNIVEQSSSTILDDTDITPIVQMIDNFERNHKLGMIYEAQVGAGSVLVCTAQIKDSEYLENQWLYESLTKYLMSDDFSPKSNITAAEFKKLFGLQ